MFAIFSENLTGEFFTFKTLLRYRYQTIYNTTWKLSSLFQKQIQAQNSGVEQNEF